VLKRFETALALLITLTVITLHVVREQHAGALWRDEAGVVQLALQPTVGDVLHTFHLDSFPLLFPLTVRAYAAVCGDSDRALRLFGMAVGLAIVGALWLNARGAGTVPLASLALLGFHPSFLFLGDSLRAYGLGTLLILLTFGAFARLVARPDRATVIAAALLAVLSVHCLWSNAALLLGLGTAAAIVGLVRRHWRVTVAALGIGLLAALSLLPYRGPLAVARDWNLVLARKLGPREILGAILAAVGDSAPAVLWVWAALLLATLLTFFLANSQRSDAQLFRLLAIPAVLGAQYGFFVALGFLPRTWYILPVMALVASALDGLLAIPPLPNPSLSNQPRRHALRAARPVAAVLLAALALRATAHAATVRMTNVDRVANTVTQGAKRRDLVLVNYWYYGVSFERYYQGQARWMTLPQLADHRLHRYDLLKARMTEDDPTWEVIRAVRRTLRSGHRVWVVGTLDAAPAGQPPLDLPPAPASPSGWQDGPYYLAWSQQLEAYLREHALRQSFITPPVDGPVSGLEYLTVRVFQQWKKETTESSGPPD
jgi:hypothetical protein